jgi:acid phosphatase type 7
MLCAVAAAIGFGLVVAALFASGTRADGPDVAGGALATTPRLIAAGDIASCGSDADEATARLLDRRPGVIATLGDNAYGSGTRTQFERCFGPTWGRHKGRIRPAPGNHDYESRDAAPYFEYFGAVAGRQGRGFYSYSVGAWRVMVLNSNCEEIGGCHHGSPQELWLRAELQRRRTRCTLAYWHHARFSSGEHGNHDEMGDLWQTLYRANADVILVGHDHDYERFAPQRPNAAADSKRGIRQFVVGTGGASLRAFESRARNSQVRNSDTHGVLVLTLRPKRYSWRFVPVAGKRFTDSGSGACH